MVDILFFIYLIKALSFFVLSVCVLKKDRLPEEDFVLMYSILMCVLLFYYLLLSNNLIVVLLFLLDFICIRNKNIKYIRD